MDEKKLVKQILRLCEKQYRKGFQHGSLHATNIKDSIYKSQEFRDRGSKQDYKKSVSPFTKQKVNLLVQLMVECQMKDMDELISLFYDYQ